MSRQAITGLAFVSFIFFAACGPEPVTGRPPPNPPGSPAVSSAGARDAGPAGRLDAATSLDADRDANSASRDAQAGSDARVETPAGSDAHTDAVVDLPTDLPASDASSDAHADDRGAFDAPMPTGARAPAIGDLVIDEVLANPTGSDLGREWIEFASRAADPLDLSLLHVADTTTDVAVPAGTLAPFALIVLGQSADPTKNGGAPVAAAYGTRLILNNEGEQVSICLGPCATGVVLDAVVWGVIGSDYDGHALVIDPTTKAFCPATDPFGAAGDFGTPGAPNPPCAQPDAGGADARASSDATVD